MNFKEISEMNDRGYVLPDDIFKMQMLQTFIEMKETLNGVRATLDDIKYELDHIEQNTRRPDY